MTLRFRLIVIVVSLLSVVVPRGGTISAQNTNVGFDRPLRLPALGVGQACPVSVGTRNEVPAQSHIFGAVSGQLWFGSGPVYFAWMWRKSAGDSATFNLDRVPIENGARRAKTPWVSVPSYSGPIVIRGRALGPDGKAIRFGGSNTGPNDRLRLQAPNEPSPLWSFWPSSILVPGPGCYGLQIDTLSATDILVFEAIDG